MALSKSLQEKQTFTARTTLNFRILLITRNNKLHMIVCEEHATSNAE